MSKFLIMAILGVIFSEIFFIDGLTEALSAIKDDGNEIQSANFSLLDNIVGIITGNIVELFNSI